MSRPWRCLRRSLILSWPILVLGLLPCLVLSLAISSSCCGGILRGQRCGRLARSRRPTWPCSLNLSTHLTTVGREVRKALGGSETFPLWAKKESIIDPR